MSAATATTRWSPLLLDLERRLALPYPERAWVLDELAGDLDGAFEAFREGGMDEAAAVDAARTQLALGPEAIAGLEALHLPAIERVMRRLPDSTREWIESLCTAIPLAAATTLIIKEVPVTLFLQEGGWAIYWILATGALAHLLLLRRAFAWFVRRDHSAASLGMARSYAPLWLLLSCVLFGVMGTALDFYVVIDTWVTVGLTPEQVHIGMKEPLPCIILGTAFAGLGVLLHAAIEAGRRSFALPDPA